MKTINAPLSLLIMHKMKDLGENLKISYLSLIKLEKKKVKIFKKQLKI